MISPHALYRYFDAGDRTLYVGRTGTVTERLGTPATRRPRLPEGTAGPCRVSRGITPDGASVHSSAGITSCGAVPERSLAARAIWRPRASVTPAASPAFDPE